MKNRIINKWLLFITATILSSCMRTRTNVGKFDSISGQEQLFSEDSQYFIIFGLFPVGENNVKTPKDGNCQVITKLGFVDFVISGFTGGLITRETIIVNVKK